MSDESKSIGRTAEKLSRNPLGIIALFIVLSEAFAALIIGLSRDLQNGQQWAHITLFVILFPVMVFIIDTNLIIKHHRKLYAPTDYRSDESFLQSVSPQQLASEAQLRLSLTASSLKLQNL